MPERLLRDSTRTWVSACSTAGGRTSSARRSRPWALTGLTPWMTRCVPRALLAGQVEGPESEGIHDCQSWWHSPFCPKPESCSAVCSMSWAALEIVPCLFQVGRQLGDLPSARRKTFVMGILLPPTGRLESVPDGAGPGKAQRRHLDGELWIIIPATCIRASCMPTMCQAHRNPRLHGVSILVGETDDKKHKHVKYRGRYWEALRSKMKPGKEVLEVFTILEFNLSFWFVTFFFQL